jgi:uncharacterized protein (DUF58 family)
MRFLDPKILRSIAHIELRARLLVEGMYASRHRSPYYGFSVEFVDHREYSPGDEPRTIDWKMLARTERYFVKRFEMESNMNVVCLLDTSRSMGYAPSREGRLSKLEYGSYLAASVCFLVQRQQDSPGLVTFGEAIRDFVPPKQGLRHLYTILARLEAIQAQGQTDLPEVLEAIGQRLTRRGIVLLLSDCYGEPARVVEGLRHLVAKGQEVILLHVMDHDEVTFPFKALTTFRDMESGVSLMSDPLRQRPLYLNRLDRFRTSIASGTVACGADYRFLDTIEPIELVLRDYLLYRRERTR